jgi:hypothetical protein
VAATVRLTELVEALVARGVELEEPDPEVHVLVLIGPRWFRVEQVMVDGETVVLVTDDVGAERAAAEPAELEHWE